MGVCGVGVWVGVDVGVAVLVGVGVGVGVDVGVLVSVGMIALDVGVGITALDPPSPIIKGRYARGSRSCAARPAGGAHPVNAPRPSLPAATASSFSNSRLDIRLFICSLHETS